jgi:hypothetical protein
MQQDSTSCSRVSENMTLDEFFDRKTFRLSGNDFSGGVPQQREHTRKKNSFFNLKFVLSLTFPLLYLAEKMLP